MAKTEKKKVPLFFIDFREGFGHLGTPHPPMAPRRAQTPPRDGPLLWGVKWGPPLKYTIFQSLWALWTPHLEISARSAVFAPGGWTPGGKKALRGAPKEVGGPKCPQALKTPGENRGYPFLTVFDKFLVKSSVNLAHFGWA